MSDDLTKIDHPFLTSDMDRHGNVRWYVRMPPERRKVRIRGEPGSEDFNAAYWAARRGEVKPPARVIAPSPGTFRFIAQAYLASRDFKSLDARYTQREKRRVIDPLIEQIGDLPAVIEVKTIRDAVRAREPAKAKKFLAALRGLYKFAMESDFVAIDPTMGIRAPTPKTDGWHSWTLDECHQYEAHHPIGTMPRTAYALGLYLACRKSDAVKLGRAMERDNVLTYTQEKNRNTNPVKMVQPIVPPLREALDACQGKRLTYLETAYGRPFTDAGFGNRFRQWCDEAELPRCSFHGLRKAAAARMADAGCSSKQMAAVLGHRTLQQVETYTRGADAAKLAADALSGIYGEQFVPPLKIVGQKSRKNPK